MSCFQNILVGIDFSHCQRLSVDTLSPVALEVFERAVWLAQQTGGRLTFLSALSLTEEVFLMLQEEHRLVLIRKIENEASEVLAELVRKAAKASVAATAVFARGHGWLELIAQVRRDDHDLVMVGTRDSAAARYSPFGDIAQKVLRHCPCPVWVCRPEPYDRPLNVLVASDLQAASEAALGLAVSLGVATRAIVHVLHVVDYPVFHLWLTALPDEVGQDFHRRVLAHADQVLHEQIERTEHRLLSEPVRVHLADKAGSPDDVIRKYVDEYAIDLLAMGTIARKGAMEVMIGNVAERLLPELTCSLLVVKPPGFRSPV
jgi:universal stress protein E